MISFKDYSSIFKINNFLITGIMNSTVIIFTKNGVWFLKLKERLRMIKHIIKHWKYPVRVISN